MYTEKGAFGQSLVRCKGGQISESFSHGLKSPKMGCSITILSTMEDTRGCKDRSEMNVTLTLLLIIG